MTAQEKTNQITTINKQIVSLREQINKAEAETKKQVEKRNQLNEHTKKAHLEIQQIRQQRDEINNRVQLLKQQRDDLRNKIMPFSDQIQTINEKKTELKKKTPHVNQRELQEELDAIEWKIQTTSLDLQEEKRLIEQVKHLETQLSGFKKIDKQNKKISELLKERKILEVQADAFHQELTELAKKSQELHVNMIAKVEEAKKARTEADNEHKAYIQNKERSQQWLVDIAVLTGQMYGLQNSIRDQNKAGRDKEYAERVKERANEKERVETERSRKMSVEQALKEKLGAQAREKLARGEKLSWNEFQLLAGDDDSDEEETQD